MKVEVVVDRSRRDALLELSIACQRMQNRLWQIWLCHHSNNRSADKLRAHFDAYRQWQETKQGDKPQWPCRALEEPLTKSADMNSFYRILSAEFPRVNVRTRGLLTNAWQSLLNKRKAAAGNLPGWVAILFGNESLPSFNRPQPIPFDKDNSRLSVGRDNTILLETRLERDETTGKSYVDRFALVLNKRKARNARVVANRIVSGEYTWKGSSLLFDRGKWYALLSYELPAKDHGTLNPDKVLYVRAGCRSPWRVRITGQGASWRFGGDGSHVDHARRAVIRERGARREHYRWAGSAQKGRGRRRADAAWTKLSSRWKDFSKRYNNEVTRQLIRLAVSRGCGRIVYLQPKDSQRNSRYLSRAGNDGRSGMYWDYFQFGTMLASKCQQEGIEYGAKPKKTKRARRATAASGV